MGRDDEAALKQGLHLGVLVDHVQESGLYPKGNGVSLVVAFSDMSLMKLALAAEWTMD